MDKVKKGIYVVLLIITLIDIVLYCLSIRNWLIRSEELNAVTLALSTCLVTSLLVSFSFDYEEVLRIKRKRKDVLVFLLSACVDTFQDSMTRIVHLRSSNKRFSAPLIGINCYRVFKQSFKFDKNNMVFKKDGSSPLSVTSLVGLFRIDDYYKKTFSIITKNQKYLFEHNIFTQAELNDLKTIKANINKFQNKENTYEEKSEYVLEIYSILLLRFKPFKRYLKRIILRNKWKTLDDTIMSIEKFKKFPSIFY